MKRALAVGAVVLTSMGVVRPAHAFGEDAVSGNPQVSTHHLNLTRALAACAGIPSTSDADPTVNPAEAEIIALYDQMTDIGTFGALSVCDAPAFTAPAPTDVGCPAGTTLAWPSYSQGDLETCFSARSGVHSSVFHFPTPANLTSLKNWALGTTTTLQGEASYAFGASGDVFSATCYKQRATTIDTGSVKAGTAQAFGMYLHAIADQWSHKICCDAWGTKADPPWCMHTKVDSPAGCVATMHKLEYGCPSDPKPPKAPDLDPTPFLDHTIEAADAVFTELVAYAAKRGYRPVLTSLDDKGGWLRRQVERFAARTGANSPEQRIALASAVKDACRAMPIDACLQDVAITNEETTCAYPLTATCGGATDTGSPPDAGRARPAAGAASPTDAAGGCATAPLSGSLSTLALGALVFGALVLGRRRSHRGAVGAERRERSRRRRTSSS